MAANRLELGAGIEELSAGSCLGVGSLSGPGGLVLELDIVHSSGVGARAGT